MVILFVDLLYLSTMADSKLCFKVLKTTTSGEVKTIGNRENWSVKWHSTKVEENVWEIGNGNMP